MTRPVRSRPSKSVPDPGQLDLFAGTLATPEALADVVVNDDAPPGAPAAVEPAQLEDDRPAEASPGAPADGACFLRGDVANLADVLRVIEAAPESTRKRDEMRSALRMTAKVLGRKMEDIPSAPAELGKLLDAANPAVVRMTRARWTRVRSLVRAALAEAGVAVMPGRDMEGLLPEWRALSDRLPTRKLKCGLSKLMSHFSRRGLKPADIDAARLEEFRVALATTSLEPATATSFNTVARPWNAAAQAMKDWPQVRLELQRDPRRYSLDWSAFPESLRTDVDAFLAHGGNQDVFADDYAPSVRKTTTDNRRQQIRNTASALALSGFPVENLTSLAVLIEIANAKAALRYLIERAGGKHTPQHENLARLLCIIARHWVKAPPSHDQALRKIASSLHIKHTGMKPKNRERLRQFDLAANRHVLLELAQRVLADVRRHDTGSKGEAVRFMMAFVVHLLTRAPLRMQNLCGLEVDRHLPRVRHGGKAVRHLVIPAEETKSSSPIEVQLPPDTDALLTVYLEKYRPRIVQPVGLYLFPGRGGELRPTDSMAQLLVKFIRRETGLVMHPHLFRHLSVKLYLGVHPHDFETPRRVLGHTSTRTTIRAYGDLASQAAHQRYDDVIHQLAADAAVVKAKPKRKDKK